MSRVPSFTQVGSQFADTDTASAIRLHTAGAGLILGANERGRPVIVSMFRAEATMMGIIGGLGLAQLVAFRAIATGARVVVTTAQLSAWSPLRQLATSARDAIEIVPPNGWTHRPGSSLRPYLVLLDSDAAAAAGGLPMALPWCTVAVVREQLTNWDLSMLGRADLILSSSLRPRDAELLCSAANIPDYAEALRTMPAESVAAIAAHGGVRWARLARTNLERQIIAQC